MQHQIQKEAAALTLCAEHGIPVPKVLGYNITEPCPWIMEEYIEGKLLSQYQLSSENEAIFSQEYGELYAKISQVTSPTYGDTFSGGAIGQFATWKEAVAKKAKLLLNDLADVYSLKESTSIVELALEKAASAITCNAPAVLFHEDLLPVNMFAEESADGFVHIGHVIDFGMSSFSSIAYSQFITRKYTSYMPPMDLSQVYGINEAELAAYEIIDMGPVVLMNYFKAEGYLRFTKQYIVKCKIYLLSE
jgi:tRNA A-37 threonylcarbamoyl transferase component Bud32